MRILKHKKGDVTTLSPTELVGWILAGAIFLVAIIIAGIFTSAYFSKTNEEWAVNNFIGLSTAVQLLSSSENKFDVRRAFPFSLPEDYVIVGFDREQKNVDKKNPNDGCDQEPVRKPNSALDGEEGGKCENTACMCLFTSNDDFMVSKNDPKSTYNVKLIQCSSFPEVDYISSIYLTYSEESNSNWFWGRGKSDDQLYNYPKEIWQNFIGMPHNLGDYPQIQIASTPPLQYSFLFIYGQCSDYSWAKDENLESRKLYIEKFDNDQKKTYIFIAPEPELDKKTGIEMGKIISDRFEAMQKKYGYVSKTDITEEECINNKMLPAYAAGKYVGCNKCDSANIDCTYYGSELSCTKNPCGIGLCQWLNGACSKK